MEYKGKKSRIESTLNWTSILKALADENRLQIIHTLLKQESSVQDLSESLDIKTYNISKHLKILETSGLVQKRKDGIHRIYHVTENLRSHLSEDNQVLDLGCCKFIFSE
ncbi:MAG: winged helix-turn-helix transcriptional regulator [Nitrospiraceae bacterium]|nr:MAG: winged helix-turn-helix transcriptional regulator [Nitrospiraceae bacterium]